MEKGKLISIDIFSKNPPMFLSKDNSPNKGYITCEVKINKDEIWEGEIVNISSSGKYVVRLTEKIE